MIDRSGESIRVDREGFVYVDNIKIARMVSHDGVICIRFCDKDRARSAERGSRYVDVVLEKFAGILGKPFKNC